MSGFKWVPSSIHGPIPSNAISCGKDRDGSEIYVGLAHHMGDELPVKVVPRRREAYISYNGKEIKVTSFQLLVKSSPRWIQSYGGQIPNGAVPAGRTVSGETLYVGRVSLGGNAHAVGKIHPSHGVLYIPYDGKEQAHRDYEILIISF